MSNINELLASVVLYSLISYLLNIPDFLVGLIFATIASQISTILPSNYKTSLLVFIPIIIFSIKYPTIMIALTVGNTDNIHTYFTNQEKNTTDNRNYVHYVNINPTEVVNKNITTIHKDNTTTTIVSEYNPNTT